MAKAIGVAATLVFAAALAGAVVFSKSESEKSGTAKGDGLTEVRGLISLDAEPVLGDPRMVELMRKEGLRLATTRVGSREMAKATERKEMDFMMPSGTVAGSQVEAAAKKVGLNPSISAPFNTPLVMASWTTIGEILEANGVAKRREGKKGVPMWDVDFPKLVALMEAKTKWSDLKKSAGYPVGRSVLVSTTDPRKSNSAAVYMSLALLATSGGEYPEGAEGVRRASERVSSLFKRQGYQESYVNGAFDDWTSIGIGKVPMAFVYESQIVAHALSRGSLPDGAAVLMPKPTVANKAVFVAFSEAAKRAAKVLESREAQEIAASHGFRGAFPEAFAAVAEKTGVGADARITELADLPSAETMNLMLEVATESLSLN